MTYTITDIGLLEMYIYIYAFIATFIIVILIYLLNNVIKFNYTSKKNNDAGLRRLIFVIGIFLNALVVFFSCMALVNDVFRPKIIENNMVVVMNALDQAIEGVTLYSIPIYIIIFLVITVLLKNKYYKNMTVFKSNNKIFGLIKTKG